MRRRSSSRSPAVELRVENSSEYGTLHYVFVFSKIPAILPAGPPSSSRYFAENPSLEEVRLRSRERSVCRSVNTAEGAMYRLYGRTTGRLQGCWISTL